MLYSSGAISVICEHMVAILEAHVPQIDSLADFGKNLFYGLLVAFGPTICHYFAIKRVKLSVTEINQIIHFFNDCKERTFARDGINF